MRVVIYGAGGIGGVVGGHLASAGYDVVLIGRLGHMNAIHQHGLRFVTPTEIKILHLEVFTSPEEIDFNQDDVVFLCMKGQDTEQALKDLRMVTEDVPIFCFQNGVRNEEIASQYFPNIYGVRVNVGSIFLNDGEVISRRDPPGWFVIGCYPTGTDDLVETVAASLRDAGFFVKVTPDVMPYKWGKLIGNLANATIAITGVRNEDVKRIEEAVRHEARELLGQAGIRWVSEEELAQEWPERNIQPRILDSKSGSSTWQSLARQQGTVETEFLNGEIVRLANQLGNQALLNEKLLSICQEMASKRETPGKYTPTDLIRLLGLG